MDPSFVSSLGGLFIGLLFGIIMQRSRFCLVGAVSSALLIRDLRHGQAYLAAWAVAIGGTSLLEYQGLVDIAHTSYRSGSLDWFGAIVGGLMFGFGAILAGGCASRGLVIATSVVCSPCCCSPASPCTARSNQRGSGCCNRPRLNWATAT